MDASSKCTHMQNQVSLGAGESVNAKMRFKDLLWETACACVKHYHSGIGVFTAELIHDSCEEERHPSVALVPNISLLKLNVLSRQSCTWQDCL